jgi:hypothetical protein
MRALIRLAAAALFCIANSGCIINMWSPNPLERTEEMLVASENLRQIRAEWRRIWFLDQPSHMTYERVHGGIGP